MKQRPENDPSNDPNTVNPSVDDAVLKPSKKAQEALAEPVQANAPQSLEITLRKPSGASVDALDDDGAEIIAASIKRRWAKAGKASNNGVGNHPNHQPAIKAPASSADGHDDQKTVETRGRCAVDDTTGSLDPTIPKTIKQRSGRKASGNGEAMPQPDPVGCANHTKSLDKQTFGDVRDPNCSTTVYHDGSGLRELTHCSDKTFFTAGCRTSVRRAI